MNNYCSGCRNSDYFLFSKLLTSCDLLSFSYLKEMKQFFLFFVIILAFTSFQKSEQTGWIRINQLGYASKGIKIAIWCSKEDQNIKTFQLFDVVTNKLVFSSTAG